MPYCAHRARALPLAVTTASPSQLDISTWRYSGTHKSKMEISSGPTAPPATAHNRHPVVATRAAIVGHQGGPPHPTLKTAFPP
jgi:hypothetical protein